MLTRKKYRSGGAFLLFHFFSSVAKVANCCQLEKQIGEEKNLSPYFLLLVIFCLFFITKNSLSFFLLSQMSTIMTNGSASTISNRWIKREFVVTTCKRYHSHSHKKPLTSWISSWMVPVDVYFFKPLKEKKNCFFLSSHTQQHSTRPPQHTQTNECTYGTKKHHFLTFFGQTKYLLSANLQLENK